MSSLRVASVGRCQSTVSRTSGILSQRASEARAASGPRVSARAQWDVVLVGGCADDDFRDEEFNNIRFLPLTSRGGGKLGARLGYWRQVAKLAAEYDVVLARYYGLDPVAWVALRRNPNVFPVLHTKLPAEIAARRHWPAGALERLFLGLSGRVANGAVGVTREIVEDFAGLSRKEIPNLVLPNGIDLAGAPKAGDARGSEGVEALFIASRFYPWQGLDLLVRGAEEFTGATPLTIHLVGKLTREQRSVLSTLPTGRVRFVAHGTLSEDRRLALAARCDLAVGSLALWRKDLEEASTLKVREYLAMGLPVYATHRDVALPPDFKHFFRDASVDLGRMVGLGLASKQRSRQEVRADAAEFIDSARVLERFLDDFERGVRSTS